MLSGKLPTGTVGNGAAPDPRGSDRDTAARLAAERTDGGEGRNAAAASDGRPARGGSGAGRRDGPSRAALERRLAAERAERRAVIERYERLLAERRAGHDGASGGGRTTAGVGAVRAWLRRACCRVRLRLSRRG